MCWQRTGLANISHLESKNETLGAFSQYGVYELVVAGSTVMEERTSSTNKSGDDSDDDGGGVVQPHQETVDTESGEHEASEHADSASNQLGKQEALKQPVRRGDRTSRPRRPWWVVQQPSANIASTDGIYVHASFKKALRSAKFDHWQVAIDAEYNLLQERQTWSLVVKPASRKILDSKRVYKIKRDLTVHHEDINSARASSRSIIGPI